MKKTEMRTKVKDNPLLKKILEYLLSNRVAIESIGDKAIYFEFEKNVKVQLCIFYDTDTRWSDNLSISLEARGEESQYISKNFKDTKYLKEILNEIMYLNFQSSFGKWIYRPQNFTVDFEVRIPIHDGKIGKDQFMTIFNDIVEREIQGMYNIFTLAQKGKLPKQKDDMNEVYLKINV